ncbi:hypothetical protein HDE_13229 [Halotydeus destructor]|nr:hypothetical protein HDE_13227 [Halotydeus destructor]KAI1282166.1 hypothetical protein HDE_13229 [Halotydeus destructor]
MKVIIALALFAVLACASAQYLAGYNAYPSSYYGGAAYAAPYAAYSAPAYSYGAYGAAYASPYAGAYVYKK